jgi:chromosome segregation ATPase
MESVKKVKELESSLKDARNSSAHWYEKVNELEAEREHLSKELIKERMRIAELREGIIRYLHDPEFDTDIISNLIEK